MDLAEWFPLTIASRPNRSFYDDDWTDFASNMDRQMRGMQRDMDRMQSNFQRLAPYMQDRGTPLDVRNAEDAMALNPVQTDKDGKQKMQMNFDVRAFKPEEISVKTKDGKFLEVQAKHEEKTENGQILRQYHRMFSIPEGVDMKGMKSMLSPEGVLQITAPVVVPDQQAVEAPKERPIAITHE